ncbi:hypothetical protein RVR_2602 [Actinacidiphila reveromycinica]|uniref:Uncharacterized protein n=1 Tax=Actinacidiphila reveromycinica TaxID=659352 RepID=A0A7U3VMW4_9ACTN|nr:hypothetical protein [Streptomyces sp. SN-593]BBA97040.1 hypothetical protein RVR_2602 [Streptomyces sp. SN-593]
MNRTPHRNRTRLAAVVGALAAAACAGGLAAADPAAAASARVVVGPATADPDYATTLTVSGTGFQSVKGGFGGIYVLFGTVGGTWRPSQGGTSGTDYAYVPDSQTKDNHGFERFVSFPGGSTLSEANGGVIAADGSWHTTLVVPGAKFTAGGTGGTSRAVDCTVERCGVITIGAHGVVNPQNETFTPVAFAAPGTAGKAAGATADGSAGKTPASGGGTSATPSARPTATATTPPATAASPSTAGAAPSAPAAPATAPPTTPVAASLTTSSASGVKIGAIALAAAALVVGGVLAARRLRGRGGAAR